MNIPILRIPFEDEEINSIKISIEDVLKSGYLAMGKNVKKFEEKFANFIKTKYTICVNSGTSAIEICLRTIGVENSSVLVPTNTFMATATSVIHAGGKIIFVDTSKEDLCIDINDLKRKIQKDTKVLILVHIGGIISFKLDEIKEICNDNNIILIEDAAHAHGSTIDNKKAGSLSKAGSFSFFPTKVITCCEGGMITTNDKNIYDTALILRDHGKSHSDFNRHVEIGYNWRMSEIHAIIGLEQMKKINWILNERRNIARLYDEKLQNINNIKLIKIPKNIKSSYYKYILYLNDNLNRDKIKKEMKNKYNVSLTGEVYAEPCHSQPVFEKYHNLVLNKNDDFPNAKYVCDSHICLPSYPGLTEEEINYVVNSLKKVIGM